MGKLRLLLVGVVVFELLLALTLLPRSANRAAVEPTQLPRIEERHFLTITVKAPDGSVVEERALETNSFVHAELLVARFAYPWREVYLDRGTIAVAQPTVSARWLLVNGTPVTAYPVYGAPMCRLVGWYAGGPTYYGDASHPAVVVLGSGTSQDGGKTLGNPLGVYALPSVTYGYNDLWFNVSVTATFSFSEATTVSEAAIPVYGGRDLIPEGTPLYATIVYDSFSPVGVPAGGELTITWTFAWKDHGAFTENWGMLWQYALTSRVVYDPSAGVLVAMNFTDESGALCGIPFPPMVPLNAEGSAPMLEFAWGTGTSPMNRSAYRLANEEGKAKASVTIGTGGGRAGIAVGGTVTSQASEVGLYWTPYTGPSYDPNRRQCRILLMRWVPQSPLPAGTPVNIYLARG